MRLRWPRTTTFRLTAFYMALFAGSAFAFLAYVYLSTAGYLYRVADETLRREQAVITEAYAQGGADAVNAYIIGQMARGGDVLYMLQAPDDEMISGTLTVMPDGGFDPRGYVRFTYHAPLVDGGTEDHVARGLRLDLPDGYQAFIAVDLGEHAHFIVQILRAIWWGAAVVIVLGLVGGLWLSRGVERRVAAVTRVLRAVQAGDLSARVPVSGAQDEYDVFGQHLNSMLTHIEEQTLALKSAGDAMAHDLRTPMTRLKTGLARLEAQSDGPKAEAVADLVTEAERVLAIFSGILALSRLEQRAAPPDMTTADLVPVIEDVAELYEPVLEDEGLNLRTEVMGPLVCRHSPSLMAQVLTNLLDNALKYADGAQTIAITARHDNEQLTLRVADDGPGIAPDDRARVLNRFVRLDQSRKAVTRRGVDAGLGLSLVDAIARLHGGRVTLTEGLARPDGGFGLAVELTWPINPSTVRA